MTTVTAAAFVKDVVHAARVLRRSPVFTLTAALSLSIGIGATTAAFTVANALFFKPPAGVSAPQRLVDVLATRDAGLATFSYQAYLELRDRSTRLDAVYAYQPVATPVSVDAGRGTERALVSLVTPNYFAALGASPSAGRLFTSEGPVAVLSHAYWLSRFGGRLDTIGQVVRINGAPVTITGVASRGFHGTTILTSDLWVSTTSASAVMGNPTVLTERGGGFLLVGGRLRTGATAADANAELRVIGESLERLFPDSGLSRLRAEPAAPIPGNLGPALGITAIMMALVSTLLLIACINLTSVLLARAAVRRREIGIRLALGASARQIVRQLLAETLLLFGLGAVAGLLVASALTRLLVRALPALPLPVDVTLAVDARVVLFTAAVALVAALASGLVPAWDAARIGVLPALRSEAARALPRLRLRHVLVASQLAFSTVLIVGAGLLVRALDRATAVDPGFDARRLETATLDLPAGRGDDAIRALATQVTSRLHQLSDVDIVSVASSAPFGDAIQRASNLTIPGAPAVGNERRLDALSNSVDSSYFSALRIPLLAGRLFTPADGSGAPQVAIVSAATARRFWPGRSALGQAVQYRANTPVKAVVVGVVADVRFTSLADDGSRPMIYVPFAQQPATKLTVIVRSRGERRLGSRLTAIVSDAAPALAPAVVRPMEDAVAISLTPQRLAAIVSTFVGMVGIALASIGLYGLASFLVAQRTREFGVRATLGARRIDIVRMVLRDTTRLTAIGTATGLTMAALATRALGRLLFGISPLDATTFGSAVLIFVGVTLVASAVPARRAAAIDPVDALRVE
jgi:predicted permease